MPNPSIGARLNPKIIGSMWPIFVRSAAPKRLFVTLSSPTLLNFFDSRLERSTSNRFEYWKPGVLGNVLDERRVAQQQEQAKQRREILANLLGESYSDKTDPAAGRIMSPMEEMTGDFLSPEKQVAMKALEVKYAARIVQAAKEGDNSEAMRKAMGDKDAEMLTLLSPDEKHEYDLRLSQSAILLRVNMGEFEPTEAEFREMFNTAKKLTDKFGFGVLTRLGHVQAGDGEAREMLDGLRAALGEQRFVEFLKQQSGGHSASR